MTLFEKVPLTSSRLRLIAMVYVVVGFLIIGLVMSAFSIAPLYAPLRENATLNLVSEAETAQKMVQAYQSQLVQVALDFSRQPELLAALNGLNQGSSDFETVNDKHEREMLALIDAAPAISGISRTDYSGQLVAQAGLPIPNDATEPASASESNVLISPPFEIQGQYYVELSTPIVSHGGLHLGRDLFLIDLSSMCQVLADFNALSDAELFVGLPGKQGTTYSISETGVIGPLDTIADLTLVLNQAARTERVALVSADILQSSDWIYVSGSLSSGGWSLALRMKNSALMAPVNRQIVALLGVLALLLLAGGIGMSFIMRPLADRMLIHADDLERQVNEKTRDLETQWNMRQQVETELARVRNQNLLILDSAGDGIIGIDCGGSVTFMNRAATELLGCTAEEMLHQPVHLLWQPASPTAPYYPPADCPVYLTLEDGKPRTVDTDIFWRACGESLPVEFTVTPLLEGQEVCGGVISFRDITERREAERALRENEERYRTVVSASKDAIFLENTAGDVLDCNAEAARMYGFSSPAEMIGLNIRALIPPDVAERIPEVIDAHASGQGITTEARGLRRDGSEFLTEVTTEVVTLQGQAAIIVFVSDITPRRQAEAALRSSEEKFSVAFHASPNLMAICELGSGRFIDVNSTFEKWTGYSRQEALGRSPVDLGLYAHPDQHHLFVSTLQKNGCLKDLEAEVRNRWGKLRIGLFNADVVTIENQQRLLMVMNDVTDRYSRERERDAMAAMASALRTVDTRAAMLPVIIDQVLHLLDSDGAAFVIRDPANSHLVVELAGGSWGKLTGSPLDDGGSVLEEAIESGRPLILDDIHSSPEPVCRQFHTGSVNSLVGLPVISQNSTLGLLVVGCENVLDEGLLRTLTAVVDIAASAIQRATLHEQTESRLLRLAALHNIDLAITSGLDLTMVQTILLAQAAVQLGNDAARILLLSQGSKTLRMLAWQGFRSPAPNRSDLPLEESFAGQVALERRIIAIPDLGKVVGSLDNEALPVGEEFVSYHGVPLVAKGEVKGVLEIFHRSYFKPGSEWLEFLENLADQAAIAIYNAELYNFLQRSKFELEIAYDTTLEGWARALELRDRETEGHSRRVADRTVQLALALGIPERDIPNVRRGALLHDIGKMVIPDAILYKTGPLSREEWAVMKTHPEAAVRLLESIPFLRSVLDIPHCHHERWDGSGYPRGLQGEAIPLAARIFSVVDVYDALLSDRPYRAAWNWEDTINYIRSQAGVQFDPLVVEAFVHLLYEDGNASGAPEGTPSGAAVPRPLS